MPKAHKQGPIRRWFSIVLMMMLAAAAVVYFLGRGYRNKVVELPEVPSAHLMKVATGEQDLSRQCVECHQQQFHEWFASQHALAQRLVTAEEGSIFASEMVPSGQTVVPSSSGGIPVFRDKRTAELWPVRAAIGVTPLVQYLLPFPGGRLQIAPLSFDPHKQEWFDAQAPPRAPEDWSYFRNRGMNWNSQCAFCHTTDLQKNYDIATDSYSTTWSAMGISCTQCHGDMEAHMSDPKNPAKNPRVAADRIMDNCASCHARREELTGRFKPGELFDDHYRLALPDQPGIYHPDGQVLDEDFEYGSLLLSRMGHRGVTCLNCHNPHSGRLKLPADNNALCLSCHSAPGQNGAVVIAPEKHTFHKAGTAGSRCIDCHMAQNVYMVRDPRRDHGFVSPDPQLTIELGIPNSCNRCHADKSTEWARDQVNSWYGAGKMESRRARQRARVIHRAQLGGTEFDPGLLAMAKSEEIAAWRATLVALLAPWRDRSDVQEALRDWLSDSSPIVRAAAIRSMTYAGGPVDIPDTLLRDPVRFVRLEAAWRRALDGQPVPDVEELRAYVDQQSDQPTGAAKQAQWALARNDLPAAVTWARKAANWDRTSAPSQEMLAMVLYSAGDRAGARKAFEAAIRLEPPQASPAFSFGLLLAEEGDLKGAIAAFEKAVAADEGFGRAWYNLGLARFQSGGTNEALEALRRAEATMPGSGDAAYAAATILIQKGDKKAALAALERALAQDPRHVPSRQLRSELLR